MVLENLARVRDRIAAAASRRGRDPNAVSVVAVVKTASLKALRSLLSEGSVRSIGENRVQDAARRRAELGAGTREVSWRFIGHLQTNKARTFLESGFSSLDSLESLDLATRLEKSLAESGTRLKVLVQVKLSGRISQSGVEPENLEEFLKRMRAYPRLLPSGLMAIAPNLEPVETVRPYFLELRRLFERYFPGGEAGMEQAELSMGMSRDFEIAVEEGATHVRLGTALFGSPSKEAE